MYESELLTSDICSPYSILGFQYYQLTLTGLYINTQVLPSKQCIQRKANSFHYEKLRKFAKYFLIDMRNYSETNQSISFRASFGIH